ncbi:uncharacterized protein NEMAJ01_2208 [Nematocida major]|uniref:uncharacterized protein n=1 Tax=Nematocida major TaxID=1912982 RepID=UPI00200736B8|nr:uncharacterized protein NEMAJ01_2208 [Nematocida major]KAH9387312.1 hypothetical protein NEMAJ01_2208 [Nematocida major]
MSALERIIRIFEANQKEQATLLERIEKYVQIEENIKLDAEHKKRLRQFLVVSEYIEQEVSRPQAPAEELSIEEKASAIQMLNKRLSQVNNTKEKAQMISNIIATYIQQNIPSNKLESFKAVLLRRLIEQVKAQVSTNKESALGYSYLLICLGNRMPLLEKYRFFMFTSALPLDCLLGMYRVYFSTLANTQEWAHAWEFISSLLNYTEEINSTFNPCVVWVFLEVLRPEMHRVYSTAWAKIEEYLQRVYVPLIDPKKYKTEIQQIEALLRTQAQ